MRAGAILIAAMALLGACAQAPDAPAPLTAGAAGADGIVVRVGAPEPLLRPRVERLAAACWLDAELEGALMLVDNRKRQIKIAAAEGEVLRVGFIPAGPRATDVRLTGPALSDPALADRMAGALETAMEGAEPAC